MKNIVRGYKVTDKNMQCRGYQFELKKEFIHSGEPVLCKNGFHFCEKLINCFDYYSFDPENRIFEIVAKNVITDDGNKSVCSVIFFEKELTWFDVLSIVNTGENNTGMGNSGNYNSGNRNSGNRNSGNRNSGNCNSGNRNSGNRNSGNCNSGYHNSGDYNSGNRNSGNHNSGNHNSGHFNTITPDTILVFNKPASREEYENYNKPNFLFFDLNEYDENGIIVKTLEYKEAFIKSWESADNVNRMRIKECPNFDYDVFFEISGIDVRKYEKECME